MGTLRERLYLLANYLYLHLLYFAGKIRVIHLFIFIDGCFFALIASLVPLIYYYHVLPISFKFFIYIPFFFIHLLLFSLLLIIGVFLIAGFIDGHWYRSEINQYVTVTHMPFFRMMSMNPRRMNLKVLKKQPNKLKILSNAFVNALNLLPSKYNDGTEITIKTHEVIFNNVLSNFTGHPNLTLNYEVLYGGKEKLVKEKLLFCPSWRAAFSPKSKKERRHHKNLLVKAKYYKITVKIN